MDQIHVNVSTFCRRGDASDSPSTSTGTPLLPASRSSPGGASPQRIAENLVSGSRGFIIPALYGLNLLTSYLLMLAVMTYNVGILIVTCTGASRTSP